MCRRHFFIAGNTGKSKMNKVILKIKENDLKKGCIVSSTIFDTYEEAELVDIKPYFPSEDTVKPTVYLSKKSENYIEVEKKEDSLIYEVNTIGEIRNVNGDNYIQLTNMISIAGRYITVFWWFHKFDTDRYRGITECNPPYEDAPRSGIFATRSPVRPNPIAMTVARISNIDIERKRIYINGIESFDKTPCLGISEYDSREHCVIDARIPAWLKHWPKSFDEAIPNIDTNEIKLIDSKLINYLSDRNTRQRMKQKSKTEQKTVAAKQREIIVYGARENNLKGIHVRIPYGKITAVVGVSGSGKSSLVNNTIYAECRRRMEYLSHSNSILPTPKVDEMTGCIPAVVINQNAIQGNSFSTVGTYTDAYDYLRNIYASASVRHCPTCGNEVIPLSREKILTVLRSNEKVKIFNRSKELIVGESLEKKVEIALEDGEGAFYAELDKEERLLFQTKQKCYHCDKLLFQMTPATFSYMDTDSRCPVCNGTGKTVIVDENKVIDHPELSLLDGAFSFYGKLRAFKENPNANWMKGQVFGLAAARNVDLEKAWCELPKAYKEALLYGTKQEVTYHYHNVKNGRKGEIKRQVEGIIPMIERSYEENSTSSVNKYMTKTICNTCKGERLGMEGRIATLHQIRYPQAAKMTFYEIIELCESLIEELSDNEYEKIEFAVSLLIEISKAAIQLGIGYLQLSQETSTLSGGEGQRLKLLGAFKNHISGILYIFDEPSKGLHPTDYAKIIKLIQGLEKEGNTIIMVEHNEDMIRIADNIIEIGPLAGERGGRLVGEGTLLAMLTHKSTQISKYMNNEGNLKKVSKKNTLPLNQEFVHMKKLTYNNLKNVSIQFPKKALTCICGVSGSGKSSLMKGEIYNRAQGSREFTGAVLVDQLPIGKTTKSIVATYIGFMDFIRGEYAATTLSVQNGWDDKYFSFNSPYGQCDTCMGEGKIKVKYTEGTLVQCPDCKGKRYKKNILSILYRGKRIDEILDMSVEEAIQFFGESGKAVQVLKSLQKVGLGYLKLGQGTSTLSGGEAARLKLAKELNTKRNGNILYLLDEPTTGLHFSDIENLLKLIEELIFNGNTIISIEHNKQFVNNCDWIIELGPGAGNDGGYVISQGAV